MNALPGKIALLLLLLPVFCQSQVSIFRHEFTNIQKSTLELNQFISMSRQKGNLASAKLALKATKDPFQAYLKEALLSHQLYGEDSLSSLEKADSISPEQAAYAQLWISHLSGNSEDVKQQAMAFEEIYPESRFLLRFEIKQYMDFILANAFNRDPGKQEYLLQKIDSCFTNLSLTRDEYLFFTLAKMDIVGRKILSVSGNKDSIVFGPLCDIWYEYQEELDAESLLKDLEPCEDSLCEDIKQKLQAQLLAEQNLSPLQVLAADVSDIVRRYQKIKDNDSLLSAELAQWENNLLRQIETEKDVEQKELMKAMTSAAIAPMEGDLYAKLKFMLSKDFVNIPVSPSFKNQLEPSLPKEILESLAMAHVDSLEQAVGKAMTPPQAKEGEEVSREDYFFLLGFLIHSREIIMRQKRALAYLTKFSQTKPTPAQLSSWKFFQGFWEQNPFYFESVNPYAQYYFPRVEDGPSLDSALWALDQSLRSYPGCVNLAELKIIFLQQYADYYDDRGAYASDLIAATIRLFALRQDEGADSRRDESFRDYLIPPDVEWMETYWDNDKVMETLLGFISAKQKEELKALLEEKMEDRPDQRNLGQIRGYFE